MSHTLSDLGTAFRKAKVDLYYSTTPSLFAIADYEENLEDNLQRLQKKINGRSTAWVKDPGFLGTWTLAPKAIKCRKDKDAGLIHASPEEEWTCITKTEDKPTAEFRLMAKCSMDFHVLSALWMLKVGHLFDEQLSSNVYGGRLRRTIDNEVNGLSLGSFKPYLKPFRDWRDGAIKTMRTALDEKKKILALTADVSSFYHRLDPGFMLDDDFHELAGVELDQAQIKLNKLFINALIAWAKETPLKTGLPVGLPASAVVANAALIRLDQFIEKQVVPLYYGRYVDDILLVMENASDIKTTDQFWEWIFSRDGGADILEWDKGREREDKSILFQPPYLKNSRVAFENSKNKLFVLSGGPGKALVNAISEQVNQRTSEWRSLPNLPEDPDTIATDLLKATNHDGEQADNLRKTDALTLHRAGFALNLRDYEAYERDLPQSAWRAQRHAFFSAVIDHLITPVTFFELAQYLSRIIRMAVACKDFKILGDILKSLRKLMETVAEDCQPGIKSMSSDAELDSDEILACWQSALNESITENIIAALPPRLGASTVREWDLHVSSHWLRITEALWQAGGMHSMYPQPIKELEVYHLQLFSHDLAHIPLRFIGLPKEMVSRRGIPARKHLIESSVNKVLPVKVGPGIKILSKWIGLQKNIPVGLYFATRPFSLQELYLVAKGPFKQENQDALAKVVLALRGFSPKEQKMPTWGKKGRVLQIPDGEPAPKQTVAVASWKTSDKSFIAAVMGKADPDSRRRYQRLNRLINELISRPDGAGYLVLPELALPTRWFMRIADKLKGRGISLITGVEYLHSRKKKVRNQVWASLTHDGLGFPSLMVYRQDKLIPAPHEEVELRRLAGVEMVPAVPWGKPPIIKHGSFRFALMVCSELTNIRYRGDLRGKVDALFVPEWNSDTDTFNALVESAALDIHAYIIQCNNRTYGDSRIRAPYKDRWKRDLLRVKGGNHDYCITGEIDILALRQFQSSHRSPSEGFKPVPDGFAEDMASDRKILPKGGSVMSQEKTKDMVKYFYRASAADFMKIPGGPVAYWANPILRTVFGKYPKLSDLAHVKQGLATADNDRFLRLWFEVSAKRMALSCDSREESAQLNARWFPHSKGGEFRKWYGNRVWLVNWENDGEELLAFRPRSVIRSPDRYFEPCLSWTLISSSSTAFRYEPTGNIIGHKGPGVFCEQDLKVLAAFLNSKVALYILSIIAPTIGFEVGQISLLPIVPVRAEADRLIDITAEDWDAYEVSWDFASSPLLSDDQAKTIEHQYRNLRAGWEETILEVQRLEEENNENFICAYGLEDELTPNVSLEEVTLSCNPHYRYGGDRSTEELENILQCDTLAEFLSYTIGCIMGRYSMDKPGLILASPGETLQDYLHQISEPQFAPDDDAILPLTDQEWFADDATNRFCEFVRVVWGDEGIEENLDFVAESLCLHAINPKRGESALDTIRRYLSTQFFKDHLRTYKKRPIYWLFSSGKHKAFECLVYLHRYNEGTLARMRTEYVIPLSAKLNAYAEKLEQDKDASTSTAETKRLEKEISTLYKQQTELAEFDEKLRHHADQRISLDLDDGVKVNYGRFGDLLAEVKAVTGQK